MVEEGLAERLGRAEPAPAGLDWSTVDIPSYAPYADTEIRSALAGHPELLGRLVDHRDASSLSG